MKFAAFPVTQAEGKILAHNIAALNGKRALRKGKVLTAQDVVILQSTGYRTVYAAELESGDLAEDTAAERIARAATGDGVHLKSASEGRASLVALYRGVVRVDAARLEQINSHPGIAFASLLTYTLVEGGQTVATIKVIPYGLASSVLEQAENAARGDTPLIQVGPLRSRQVGLILSGYPGAQARVVRSFEPPLRRRVEALGSRLESVDYVRLSAEEDAGALALALGDLIEQGMDLILMASETSIMDGSDIAPQAVERAGGWMACIGAPVDPGNLLMLAYMGNVPVLGVPGCARSPRRNVVDWILPALLAGYLLSAADVARLGHGGLLQEDPKGHRDE